MHHALVQHAARTVLAGLELIANDGHLAYEILLAHQCVHHPVGFESQCPVEVIPRCRERFIVIGPVVGRGAVVACPPLGQLLLRIRVAGRSLEQHVLQQVRHAFFAVPLVARSDEVGDVDHERVNRRVWHEQYAQSVVEAVFGHPFDAGDLFRGGGECRCECKGCEHGRSASEEGSSQGHRGRLGEWECI